MSRTDDPAWPQHEDGWRHDAPDPPDAFPVPFDVFDGIALVIWSIVAQLLVALPFALAGVEFGTDVPSLVVFMATQFVILGGVLAWLAGRGSLSWRVLGPLRPSWPRHVLVGFGVGVGGFLIVTITVTVANALVGPLEAPSQALLETTTAGGLATVLSVAIAVVLAPVVEELIFRGVLFQALRRRLGLWPGLVLSSIAFAVVHIEVTHPVFSAALLALAVWLAAAFHRTGSLAVPIVGHAVFNGITVTLALAAN